MVTVRTSSGLLRVLGTTFALAIALGNMVGSGIFRSPGAVVGLAGSLPLAAALIVAVGIQSLLSANLLAEVASSVALSGGSVVIIRRAFGDTAAMIVGWTDALSCVAGTAQAAAAAAGFLAVIIPILAGYSGATGAALLVVFGMANWRGVVIGEMTQMVTSAIQGVFLLGIIGLLFWVARVPAPAAAMHAHPLLSAGGIVMGYQLVYGTFVGWNNAAYFAEETEQAGRSISRAMSGSIVCFAGLYLAMIFALGHALPITLLAGAAFPAQLALGQALGPIGISILAATAFFILATCMNSGIMPGSRVMFALGRARYAPQVLTQVNAGGTPQVALLLFMALGIVLVLSGRYETIFALMGTLALAVTAAMDAAFFQLRRREPALFRPYRAIGFPVLPAMALIADVAILGVIAASDIWGAAGAALIVIIGIVVARLTEAQRRRPNAPVQA